MAIYRVNHGIDDDGHCGYSYHTSKRKAKQALAKEDPTCLPGDVRSKPTPRNKREWVALLNEWGSHREDG